MARKAKKQVPRRWHFILAKKARSEPIVKFRFGKDPNTPKGATVQLAGSIQLVRSTRQIYVSRGVQMPSGGWDKLIGRLSTVIRQAKKRWPNYDQPSRCAS